MDGSKNHPDILANDWPKLAVKLYGDTSPVWTADYLGWKGPTTSSKTWKSEGLTIKEVTEIIIKYNKAKEDEILIDDTTNDDDIEWLMGDQKKERRLMKSNFTLRKGNENDHLKLFSHITGMTNPSQHSIEKYVRPTPYNGIEEPHRKRIDNAIMKLQVGLNISQNRIVNRDILPEFIAV